jgi:hypothetical protein
MNLPPSINFVPKYLSKVRSWHENLPFAYDLISVLKPKTFVELGTHYGDSYFTFCQSIVENKLSTKAFAIDHWLGDEQAGIYNEEVFERVNKYNEQNYLEFSSLIRKTFDDALNEFKDNSIDLLHIDGHHSYESVKNDFNKWRLKVRDGGIFLLHDILVTSNNFGVHQLWDEISRVYPCLNLSFAHGLGVLKNSLHKNINYVVSPEFDELICTLYYKKMGISINEVKC